MANRVPLVQISSRSWEHPADRAALNTLRAIPGFDEVVRKVAGFFGERGIRQLFLGDAVKVTAEQRPRLNAMWTEVLETMDWPERPELYVTQTPIVNAMAVVSYPQLWEFDCPAAINDHLYWGALLLVLAACGPGKFSLDAWLTRKRSHA